MDYEKCYIFTPETATTTTTSEKEPPSSRPPKRRKLDPPPPHHQNQKWTGLQTSWPTLRQKAYHQAWTAQQARIDAKVNTINAGTVGEIAKFLDEKVGKEPCEGRIPAGLILAGPSPGLRGRVGAGEMEAGGKVRRVVVRISSGSVGGGLKGMVRTIISKSMAGSEEEGDDDEDDDGVDGAAGGKGRGGGAAKLLKYDFQILHDFVRERRIQQVVIAVDDTEAFDSGLLSELIELLSCWQGRIPFACLFNIATSVEFLQQRLSRAAVKCLDGRLFDAELSTEEVEAVFEAIASPDVPVWLGGGLVAMMLERQSDYIQSIDCLAQATRYAYMSCYFANALSVFLDAGVVFESVEKDHFEAVRNLESFRREAMRMLEEGETALVRDLLEEDSSLFTFTLEAIERGRTALAEMLAATEVIRMVQQGLPNIPPATAKSKLYVQAMSGKLLNSPQLRALFLSLRKAPSNITQSIISTINSLDLPEPFRHQFQTIQTDLDDLLLNTNNPTLPLRSEDDLQNSTLRTTVVAQKVSLSKQKSVLSSQDAAYTTLIRNFSSWLQEYLQAKLIHPKEDLPFHEIFIYDFKSPYREVFTPRPRRAIERALASPWDYLDCECCAASAMNGQSGGGDGEEVTTLAASQPATAVLYQLYLESGALINVSDLWQAFQAVVGNGEQHDEDEEKRTMALFQRGLAELKYLGFVKATRKRVDHVAKVAWRGL